MKFFKRLRLVLSYGPEIDELLEATQKEREARRWEANKHRLNLCYKHRQEPDQSHYSPHNCDHCRLLERLNDKE